MLFRSLLQSPDPGPSVSKHVDPEVWSVTWDTTSDRTALVITGPELVHPPNSNNTVHIHFFMYKDLISIFFLDKRSID